MTAHTVCIGKATHDGLWLWQGDGYRQVQPTREPIVATLTPLGADLAALCDAILRGDVEPCPVCGRYDCDMDEWHDLMHCDVHGDLSELKPDDLPY